MKKKIMNYFEYHGASHVSIKESERKILENAIGWGDNIEIKVFDKRADDSFGKEKKSSSQCFVSGDKLYEFIPGRYIRVNSNIAPIESFFELNTSKNKCLNGNCGVYYEYILNNNPKT